MKNLLLVIFGKLAVLFSQTFNLGNGSTWPGHIALQTNPHFIKNILKNSSTTIIMIAGTNGKTTTTSLIRHALEEANKTVFQNEAGANLLNGIASSLITASNFQGKITQDFALFEVDESALPLLLTEIKPHYLILLNLFRDQLDRYGEVHTIAKKWKEAIGKLPSATALLLNADDPEIAYLGLHKQNIQARYFGLQDAQFSTHTRQHAADSIYCPRCGEKLFFKAVSFAHLGDWSCKNCDLKRPPIASETFIIYPLSGLYNKYNVLAASSVLKHIGLTDEEIKHAFTSFKPAFGRQEILSYKNKRVQIFLSKNPTSFNQSYQAIQELSGKNLLIVLNDRIPDGLDVSWIWDTELPNIQQFRHILLSGDRVHDMALRIKYEEFQGFQTFEHLEDAIETGIDLTKQDETLFILPTYSAMLDVRKILTGRKIL